MVAHRQVVQDLTAAHHLMAAHHHQVADHLTAAAHNPSAAHKPSEAHPAVAHNLLGAHPAVSNHLTADNHLTAANLLTAAHLAVALARGDLESWSRHLPMRCRHLVHTSLQHFKVGAHPHSSRSTQASRILAHPTKVHRGSSET